MGWDVVRETCFLKQGLYSTQQFLCKLLILLKQHLGPFHSRTIRTTPVSAYTPKIGFMILWKTFHPCLTFVIGWLNCLNHRQLFCIQSSVAQVTAPHTLTSYVPDETHFVMFCLIYSNCFLVVVFWNAQFQPQGCILDVEKELKHPHWSSKIKYGCCKTSSKPACPCLCQTFRSRCWSWFHNTWFFDISFASEILEACSLDIWTKNQRFCWINKAN